MLFLKAFILVFCCTFLTFPKLEALLSLVLLIPLLEFPAFYAFLPVSCCIHLLLALRFSDKPLRLEYLIIYENQNFHRGIHKAFIKRHNSPTTHKKSQLFSKNIPFQVTAQFFFCLSVVTFSKM